MKLERHPKINKNNKKDTKIPKNIEKKEDICLSFDTLGSIRTF
jgi:hypothetical protein